MPRFTPDYYHLTYGPHEPATLVKPGDTITASTVDAAGVDAGGRRVPQRLLKQGPGERRRASNPLVGPIFVEGARPGDALAVTVRRIRLTRDWAWSAFIPHFGCFTGEMPGRKLQLLSPMRERRFRWELDTKKKSATLRMPRSRIKRVTIPLHPFIGSIGVAPRWGRVELSLTPGEYGGNMDCPDTAAGTTILLPVFVDGALLSFGDVHAAQGDGEVCGVALETTAEVTLHIDVMRDTGFEQPRLIDRNFIMTVGSARPLIDAYRLACAEMVGWLAEEYGFHRDDALQLFSQVGRARIGNVCDPRYSVVAKFPKTCLPRI